MMKKINWPKVKKLTKNEKIWLQNVYKITRKNENPSFKRLKIDLMDVLPASFDPKVIDKRIAGYNGFDLTLLGIYAIDPKSDLIEIINLIANQIRKILLVDPERKQIKSAELATELKMPVEKISVALKFMGQYGSFWRTAMYSGFGYSEVDLNSSDEIFNNYFKFTCIEDLINKSIKDEAEEAKKVLASTKTQRLPTPIPGASDLITIKPLFRSRIESIDKNICFVLMPFVQEWSERVYQKFIKNNVEKVGLQCIRADNLNGPIVIEDIWIKINQAAFVIADVTGTNPNVMYELGIAHTIGKPVILITQDTDAIPFDTKHMRHHTYSIQSADGEESFATKLKEVIVDTLKREYGYSPKK